VLIFLYMLLPCSLCDLDQTASSVGHGASESTHPLSGIGLLSLSVVHCIMQP
jgi:hypothetical protein